MSDFRSLCVRLVPNPNSCYCWTKVCLQARCETMNCVRTAVDLFNVADTHREFSGFSSQRNFCHSMFKIFFPFPLQFLALLATPFSHRFNPQRIHFAPVKKKKIWMATSSAVLPNADRPSQNIMGYRIITGACDVTESVRRLHIIIYEIFSWNSDESREWPMRSSKKPKFRRKPKDSHPRKPDCWRLYGAQ